MKLTELLQNQRIIVQLLWEEQKIEFFSDVIDNDGISVFVTPYVHNGKVLELNVTLDKSVICNIFADDPVTNKRISWKGIELTTVTMNNNVIYSVKARGYNAISNIDDRRSYERIAVQIDASLNDEHSNSISITVHDISATGLSFLAPQSYVPKGQQVHIEFTDKIGDVTYENKLECSISRTNKRDGRNFIGCRIIGENRDYKIYELLKRLRSKGTNRIDSSESATQESNSEPEANSEPEVSSEPEANSEPEVSSEPEVNSEPETDSEEKSGDNT